MNLSVPGADKAHTRKLEISTYKTEKDAVIVKGELKDECFVTRYMTAGEHRPPGIVHHMIVRMKVRGPSLIIEEVEVEMPTVPREDCRNTQDTLSSLAGMSISSGFTIKVKDMLGGPKSCSHLVSLVLSMAPAAVQGAWAALSSEQIDPSIYAERAIETLSDTCWVWRKNGPLFESYRRRLEEYL